MTTLVSTDELARDVTGAEALLERHQVGVRLTADKSLVVLSADKSLSGCFTS